MKKKPNAFTVGLFAFVGVFLFMPNTLNNANLHVKWLPLIRRAEIKYGIPEDILYRLIKQESSFNEKAIGTETKYGRALGLGQIMLKWHPTVTREQALSGVFSIDYCAKYLAKLAKTFGGDWKKAVAAYNWGEGNLQKFGLAKAPPETVDYIKKVYYG